MPRTRVVALHSPPRCGAPSPAARSAARPARSHPPRGRWMPTPYEARGGARPPRSRGARRRCRPRAP
eukprot:4510591-Prymnesium_polylepis.1